MSLSEEHKRNLSIAMKKKLQCGYTPKNILTKGHIINLGKTYIHHIDYDKINNNIINLISLCKECHSKTNSNREFWRNYYTNKMEVKILAQNLMA